MPYLLGYDADISFGWGYVKINITTHAIDYISYAFFCHQPVSTLHLFNYPTMTSRKRKI